MTYFAFLLLPFEPVHEKNNNLEFGPGLTNRAVQPQKQPRSLKFQCVAKTKKLISCAVTAQLICVFVFAYADCWFLMQGLICKDGENPVSALKIMLQNNPIMCL